MRAVGVGTSDQPYRDARSHMVAVEEIVAGSGTQFDPEVVDALLRLTGCDLPDRANRLAGAVASTNR